MQAGQPDPFRVLGVPATATDDEVKAAYRALAKKFHPDVNRAEDAATKFKEATEAYAAIKSFSAAQREARQRTAQWDASASGVRQHMRARMEEQAAAVSRDTRVRMQQVVDARAATRRRSLMLTTLALGGLAVYVVYKEATKRDRDSSRRDLASMRQFGSGSSAVQGISKAAESDRR
ncbi:hypothetical protein FNF27_05733 [Cafeteria roenbergensis]|uniref:J domain-containing protein n=1 Tax=Cafeteria roenbergensis TaxID=33653 RepID=A0A5A8C7M9_CAFRO|nr:hypothetical protein FNF29_06587 [Cafeteria roenbergensis]KAA0154439.1 hypothetical protein FNF28_06823 [Cafeteria roenbergensis]KAA0172753.1 hypothetical protein FNF27_05733 [Cafeteria roenbergensis]|eukprot:KAA0148529.1 hypothetical protein FNF29_06587 [Cafeteria roenbergensis]